MKRRVICYTVFLALYVVLMFLWPRLPQPPLNIYRGALEFDETLAFADLVEIAERFPSRVAGSAVMTEASAWVAERFAALGLTPAIGLFRGQGLNLDGADWSVENTLTLLLTPRAGLMSPVEGRNVTAVLPGGDREAGVIVVCAHLDSIPGTPGADDNASGVAAMLELARVMSAAERDHTLVFVALDSEESGLYGSRAWIRTHITGRDRRFLLAGVDYGPVRLAVNLDCVAWEKGALVHIMSMTWRGRGADLGTAALVRELIGYEDRTWEARRTTFRSQVLFDGLGFYGPSDHSSFLAAGVSAVGLGASDGSFAGIGEHINTASDDLSKVSPETLGRVGRFAEKLIRGYTQTEFPGYASMRVFLLHPRGFTPGWLLSLCVLLLIGFLAALGRPALPRRRDRPETGEGFLPPDRLRPRKEVLWYARVAAIAAAAGLLVAWPAVTGRLASLYLYILLGLTAAAAAILLARARRRRFRSPAVAGAGDGAGDGPLDLDYLSLALAVWALLGWAILGPGRLIYMILGPALIFGRLRGQTPVVKVLYRILLVAWMLGWLVGQVLILEGLTMDARASEVLALVWLFGLGLLVFPTVWEATARSTASAMAGAAGTCAGVASRGPGAPGGPSAPGPTASDRATPDPTPPGPA